MPAMPSMTMRICCGSSPRSQAGQKAWSGLSGRVCEVMRRSPVRGRRCAGGAWVMAPPCHKYGGRPAIRLWERAQPFPASAPPRRRLQSCGAPCESARPAIQTQNTDLSVLGLDNQHWKNFHFHRGQARTGLATSCHREAVGEPLRLGAQGCQPVEQTEDPVRETAGPLRVSRSGVGPMSFLPNGCGAWPALGQFSFSICGRDGSGSTLSHRAAMVARSLRGRRPRSQEDEP